MFTDIEGSTRLLHELGQDAYREALGEHRRVVREAFAEGYEVDYEGDAFFYAFGSAEAAVGAVSEAMRGLETGSIRIRVGIHTGEPGLDPPKYVGMDVHFAARVMSAGHGGQVLLSRATRELVEAETLDLGEHRLKDIEGAVSLFQLGGDSFPPLKTISNTNLPRPASSFVGREREVAEVVALVRGGARLVTLTGPGGTGKTRLAIEAAAELVPEFKAGAFWVGLASLRDAALVAETAAQTLGATVGLAEHIGERALLLLLDNLEQVIGAAPELAELAESCPNLVLLITSRELLRVRGELEYQVLPLAASDAVDLFTTRAEVRPSAAVEELCRRLDSIPLALELAAARARVLTVEQTLERLSQRLDLFRGGRDSDPRQQTLRATIEWSYELLAPAEQRLFTRLSVFAGGCTLDAAEEVADADLDTLQSLVEKSLVRRTDGRFWMLETIREFAVDQLGHTGEGDAYRRRHLDWFLTLAEENEFESRGGDRQACFVRLETDHDNLRAALDRAREIGDPELELRLATALWRFWADRGHVREGSIRLDEALRYAAVQPLGARIGRCYIGTMTGAAYADLMPEAEAVAAAADAEGDRFTRVQALTMIGMSQIQGTGAEALLEEAIALSGGDYPAEEAEAIGWLLVLALYGPLPCEQAIARCRAFEGAENRKVQAFALAERAALEAMRGEFDIARRLLGESREIFRELNLRVFGANTAQEGYFVEMLAGDPKAAAADLRMAYDLLAEMGERGFLSTIAGYLAHACLASGDAEGGDRWAEACAEAAAEDDWISQLLWRSVRGRLLALEKDFEGAVSHARDAVEIAGRIDQINTLADRLVDLAEVFVLAGMDEPATRALDEALALYEQKGNLVSAGRVKAAIGR